MRNYPNPFASKTMIEIPVSVRGHVTCESLTCLVNKLQQLQMVSSNAGLHTFEWDAGDAPSGTYLCQLDMGGQVLTTQITVEK